MSASIKKFKKKNISKALIESVIQTFEEMAFLDVQPVSDINTVNFTQIIYIGILDPLKGSMALYLPVECKRIIIENIYGDEFNNLSPREIDDCLLEILNVLAGCFLGKLYATTIRYRVDIPKILFDETEISLEGDNYLEQCFDAEGDHFKVAVALKNN